MKSHTDISQSKQLAEILPIESADMWFVDGLVMMQVTLKEKDFISKFENVFPCWSLAALLDTFDDKAGLAKDYNSWFCYDNGKSYCTRHHTNAIDACYEMILKLNEQNLL